MLSSFTCPTLALLSNSQDEDDNIQVMSSNAEQENNENDDTMDFMDGDMNTEDGIHDLFNLESFEMLTDSFSVFEDPFRNGSTNLDNGSQQNVVDNNGNNGNNSDTDNTERDDNDNTNCLGIESHVKNQRFERRERIVSNESLTSFNEDNNANHPHISHGNEVNRRALRLEIQETSCLSPLILHSLSTPVTITDYSPEWSYTDGGVKVLVAGPWFANQNANLNVNRNTNFNIVFDGIIVSTSLIQNGVLKCFSPAHEPGFVSLQVALDGNPISNTVMFEYRERQPFTSDASSPLNVTDVDGQSYFAEEEAQEDANYFA